MISAAWYKTQELHGILLDVRLQRELRVYPVVEVLQCRTDPVALHDRLLRAAGRCDDRRSCPL